MANIRRFAGAELRWKCGYVTFSVFRLQRQANLDEKDLGGHCSGLVDRGDRFVAGLALPPQISGSRDEHTIHVKSVGHSENPE